MGRMKRMAVLLLALALLTPAWALGEDGYAFQRPGDEVETFFSVTENPDNAVAATIRLRYDHDALELIPTSVVQNDSTFALDLKGIPVGFEIIAQFRVKENAADGVYRIELETAEAGDINENWVDSLAYSGFTVEVGRQESEEDWGNAAPAGDFEYTLSSGQATITKYLGSAETVVIPDTLDGCAVTAIGARAFYHFSGIGRILVPQGVVSIGERAFYHCTGLTRIVLPDTLETIDESAFQGCRSLNGISLPDSLASIGKSAFSGCESLTAAVRQDSYAMQYCRDHSIPFTVE